MVRAATLPGLRPDRKQFRRHEILQTKLTSSIRRFEQLELARKLYVEYEPRDLLYRAATELVALAIDRKTTLSVGESLAVLLQIWNSQYYRFHPFDSQHFHAIEQVVSAHRSLLDGFRFREITTMSATEVDPIAELFTAFELVLGPVGAAKALHLLAPEFFPLWDREITKAYGIYLAGTGQNAIQYLQFMTTVISQILNVCPSPGDRKGMLKRIDEFNYCRFTKDWL